MIVDSDDTSDGISVISDAEDYFEQDHIFLLSNTSTKEPKTLQIPKKESIETQIPRIFIAPSSASTKLTTQNSKTSQTNRDDTRQSTSATGCIPEINLYKILAFGIIATGISSIICQYFNTDLKPLEDKIATQEKRILELETQNIVLSWELERVHESLHLGEKGVWSGDGEGLLCSGELNLRTNTVQAVHLSNDVPITDDYHNQNDKNRKIPDTHKPKKKKFNKKTKVPAESKITKDDTNEGMQNSSSNSQSTNSNESEENPKMENKVIKKSKKDKKKRKFAVDEANVNGMKYKPDLGDTDSRDADDEASIIEGSNILDNGGDEELATPVFKDTKNKTKKKFEKRKYEKYVKKNYDILKSEDVVRVPETPRNNKYHKKNKDEKKLDENRRSFLKHQHNLEKETERKDKASQRRFADVPEVDGKNWYLERGEYRNIVRDTGKFHLEKLR